MDAKIEESGHLVFLKLDEGLIRFSKQQIENCVVANTKTINKRYHSYLKALQKVYEPSSNISRNQLMCHMNKFDFTNSKLDKILVKKFIKELEN